jgi:phage tail-like protein
MRKLILIAVLVVVAAGAGIAYVLASGDDTRRAAALTRSYSTGKIMLQSDGLPLGFLKSVSCGAVSADVTREEVGELRAANDAKHIGPAKYESCELTLGWSMNKSVFSWISGALAGKTGPKNLTLSYLDYNYVEKSRLELDQAAIAKVTMPALDAASNTVVYMTLTVAAQSIRSAAGSGATLQSPTTTAKNQLASAFRFEWAGSPLTKVTSVEGWSFELDPATQKPLLGELNITVNETDPRMAAVNSSFKKFVIDGNNSDEAETTASIVYLSSNLAANNATVAFTGVGWAAGELVGATSADGSTAKRRYTLYVEGANLTVE